MAASKLAVHGGTGGGAAQAARLLYSPSCALRRAQFHWKKNAVCFDEASGSMRS